MELHAQNPLEHGVALCARISRANPLPMRAQRTNCISRLGVMNTKIRANMRLWQPDGLRSKTDKFGRRTSGCQRFFWHSL